MTTLRSGRTIPNVEQAVEEEVSEHKEAEKESVEGDPEEVLDGPAKRKSVGQDKSKQKQKEQ